LIKKATGCIGAPKGEGGGLQLPPPNRNLKRNTDFVGTIISEPLCDSRFSLDHSLKLVDYWLHWNIEEYNKSLGICRFFFSFSVLIFSLAQLDVGSEILILLS